MHQNQTPSDAPKNNQTDALKNNVKSKPLHWCTKYTTDSLKKYNTFPI